MSSALSAETVRIFTLIRSNVFTDDQIKQVVADFISKTLKESEENRACGLHVPRNEDELENKIDGLDYVLSDYRERLAYNNLKVVEDTVDALIVANALQVEKGSEGYQILSREILKAVIRVGEIERERLEGNYNNAYDNDSLRFLPVSDNVEALQGKAKDKGKTLSELIEEYVRERRSKDRWEERTEKREYRPIYEVFQAFIKERYGREDVGIKELTKDDFLSYCGMLKGFPVNRKKKARYNGLTTIAAVLKVAKETRDKPMSIATRNKYIERVGFVFHYAHKNGYIPVNYASDLSAADNRSDRDKGAAPLSIEDLNRLFNSPLYRDTPESWRSPENFFIPLISLFSGMRVEEICKLRLEDVKESPEGICYFDVRHDIEKKGDKGRAKTKSSRRSVPIHPKLRELGFFAFYETVKRAGKRETVFNVKMQARGKYSERFEKFYQRFNAKYMQQHPEDKHRKTFHSLRTTFMTQLYLLDVRTETMKDIVGHAQDGETFGTYIPAQLVKAYEALKQVDYRGLDLSSLKLPLS